MIEAGQPTNDIEYRQSTLADLEFLDSVNTICMRGHVEKVMSWNSELYRQTFDPAEVVIVTFKGMPIGLLKLIKEPEEYYLGDIMILPEFQNKGIGGAVVQEVVRQASSEDTPIRLKVLVGSPAKRLYERLGFEIVGQDEQYITMRKPV